MLSDRSGSYPKNKKEIMEKKMMQSIALEQVQNHLLKLTRLLEQTGVQPKPQIAAGWAEGKEVMKALNISQRTLQTLRDNHTLGYSRLGGKYYYRISDIEDLLRNNYVMFRLSARGQNGANGSDNEKGGRP